MDAAFKALAEPTRREILRLVGPGEMTAGDIAARFEVTRPAISQHLRVLREAGLVEERREGTRRWYRARPDGLSELKESLESMWDQRLLALKVYAEQAERRKRIRVVPDRGRRGGRDRK